MAVMGATHCETSCAPSSHLAAATTKKSRASDAWAPSSGRGFRAAPLQHSWPTYPHPTSHRTEERVGVVVRLALLEGRRSAPAAGPAAPTEDACHRVEPERAQSPPPPPRAASRRHCRQPPAQPVPCRSPRRTPPPPPPLLASHELPQNEGSTRAAASEACRHADAAALEAHPEAAAPCRRRRHSREDRRSCNGQAAASAAARCSRPRPCS